MYLSTFRVTPAYGKWSLATCYFVLRPCPSTQHPHIDYAFRQLHEELHHIGNLVVLYLFTFRVTPTYGKWSLATCYFVLRPCPSTQLPHIDYALAENNFVVNYYMTGGFWNPQVFLSGIKYQSATRFLSSTCLNSMKISLGLIILYEFLNQSRSTVLNCSMIVKQTIMRINIKFYIITTNIQVFLFISFI